MLTCLRRPDSGPVIFDSAFDVLIDAIEDDYGPLFEGDLTDISDDEDIEGHHWGSSGEDEKPLSESSSEGVLWDSDLTDLDDLYDALIIDDRGQSNANSTADTVRSVQIDRNEYHGGDHWGSSGEEERPQSSNEGGPWDSESDLTDIDDIDGALSRYHNTNTDGATADTKDKSTSMLGV